MLEKAGEQEGDSDFTSINFEILEGHLSRNVEKTFENSGLKLEDLGK